MRAFVVRHTCPEDTDTQRSDSLGLQQAAALAFPLPWTGRLSNGELFQKLLLISARSSPYD